jgi:glycosyltransferase involved in cell wall biosynthesis
MKFSTIIPAHNEESHIRRTLETIKKYGSKNNEIIVVLDSCTDNTEEIAREFTNKLIETNSNAPSDTRNLGAKHAEGEMLVFIDADSIISSNYYSEIQLAFERGSDYGFAKYVSESKNTIGRYIAFLTTHTIRLDKNIPGNFFIKKDIFNKQNGFLPGLVQGEDSELGSRLKKSKCNFKFLNNAYIIPSERKYHENGWVKEHLFSLKKAALWTFHRNKFIKNYTK